VVAAETELRANYEILERVSDWGHLSSSAPEMGDAVYSQGRYEEALRISEFCESISIEGDVDAECRWRQLRAKILARQGRMEEAEALAKDAVRLAEETDYLLLRAHALRSLAEVLRLGDRTAEAADALRAALELERRKGNLVGQANTQSLLDELAR
jgi:tetratricopeptide (TPR) repeat protein